MDVLKRLSRFLAGADLPEQQRDGGREIRLAGLILLVGTLTAAILLGLLLIPADYRVLIFDVTSSAIVYPLVCIALIVTCVTPDAAPQVVEARGDAFGTRRFAFRRNRGRAVSADDATISVASTRATDTGGERP
jgi:hypothetical protein